MPISPLVPSIITDRTKKMIHRAESEKVLKIHTAFYNMVDLGMYGCKLVICWVRHPILSWNLYYGKQQSVPLAKHPYIHIKILSNKHHTVAVKHSQFPKDVYVTEIYPHKQDEAEKEIVSFFKVLKEIESRKNPETPRGTTYRSRNN